MHLLQKLLAAGASYCYLFTRPKNVCTWTMNTLGKFWMYFNVEVVEYALTLVMQKSSFPHTPKSLTHSANWRYKVNRPWTERTLWNVRHFHKDWILIKLYAIKTVQNGYGRALVFREVRRISRQYYIFPPTFHAKSSFSKEENDRCLNCLIDVSPYPFTKTFWERRIKKRS